MASKYTIEQKLLRRALADVRILSCFAPLVYRNKKQKHKVSFEKGRGKNIRLRLPSRGGSAEGPVFQAQPVVERETNVRVNFHRHTGFEQNLVNERFNELDFYRDHVMSGWQDVIANYDIAVAGTICNVYNMVGTPGQDIQFTDFTNARALQNEQGIMLSGRNSVLSSNSYGAIADELKTLFRSQSKEDITAGYQGDLMNFRIAENENIPTHTVGEHGGATMLIAGANQTGNTLTIDDATPSTQILNKGDVIQVAQVASVHPITKLPTMRLAFFVVTAPVVSDGAGAATVPIYPAINDGTLTDVNEEGQLVSLKNYQNVSAAPEDNAPIKVWGESGATYEQIYYFHKHAICAQDVQLMQPDGCPASNFAVISDSKTGCSASYIKGFDPKLLEDVKRIDLLAAIKAIQPEFAVKQFGRKRTLEI